MNFFSVISSIPGEYLDTDFKILERQVNPTKTDKLLKNSFWHEQRLAYHFKRPIKAAHIYIGICSYQHWKQRILTNSKKLAWILRTQHTDDLTQIVKFSHKKILDILSLESSWTPKSAKDLLFAQMDLIALLLLHGIKQRSKNSN